MTDGTHADGDRWRRFYRRDPVRFRRSLPGLTPPPHPRPAY